MGRRKVEEPKNKKALRLRDTDLERYHKAMKKQGSDNFNAFVEQALNELSDRILQGNTERVIPTDPVDRFTEQENRMTTMEKKLASLSRAMDKLRHSIEASVKEPANAT